MMDTLTAKGFTLDDAGVWSRVDDVYVTRIEHRARSHGRAPYLVSVTNLDAPDERATVRFRLTADGRVFDTDERIDIDTAESIARDIIA